jgi:hypothetical protein
MRPISSRRATLVGLGAAAAAVGAGSAKATSVLTVPGATALTELAKRMAAAPRRRDFRTVPMILNNADQWDNAALNELIAYRGGPKQVWDNTDIGGPWLNLMRNSLNAQIWSFRHKDFLAVSATHGSAHLALFDQATWDKYQIAKLTGHEAMGAELTNHLIPGVVLTPGVVGTLPELQQAGFHYAA